MSPDSADRYGKLLRKAIKLLPEEEQDVVLEHLLTSGSPRLADMPRREVRTEVRKVRRRGGGDIEDIDIDGDIAGDIEPIMIRVKRRHEGEGGGERREVVVERVKGPLSQMVPMRLSDEQHTRFKKWCEDHDTSMAEIVRTLIERFLEEQAS